MVKNSPANARDVGDMGSIPGSRRSPGGGCSNPLQYSLPAEFHGHRSLSWQTKLFQQNSNFIKTTLKIIPSSFGSDLDAE